MRGAGGPARRLPRLRLAGPGLAGAGIARGGLAGAGLIAAVPPAVEVAGLYALGVPEVGGIAVHSTAPPPFGVFHDLRWMLVFHTSWSTFVAALLALLAVRVALNTALVALVWPAGPTGSERPSLRRLATAQLCCTALALVLLSPWAVLAFVGAATSLSLPMLGALLPMLLLGLVMNRGGMAPGWWRRPPSPRSLGIGVLTFLFLCLASAGVSYAPGWTKALVAALLGLAQAGLWAWLVRTLPHGTTARRPAVPRPAARRSALLTPLVIVLVPALVAGGGYWLPDMGGGPEPGGLGGRPAGGEPPRLPATDGRQVLALHGFGSSYDRDRITGYPPDLVFSHFSYRGQYPNGAPRPYGPAATHQPLPRLAKLLADQVSWLHERSGEDITLVAVSEGALIADTYLRQHPDAPVDTLVMVSPLLRPVRAYYPPPEADDGWGLVTGWQVRLLVAFYRQLNGGSLSADGDFARSLLNHAPRYRTTLSCPLPGVDSVAFVPSASAVAVPPGPPSHITSVEVRGFHGSLNQPHDKARQLVAALRGKSVEETRLGFYQFLQGAAAGWQVPTLPLGFVARWADETAEDADREGSAPGCTGSSR